MTPRYLIQKGICEYQRLIQKSKAKNITAVTRATILHKAEEIRKGIDYIIQTKELDGRTIKIIVPRWEEIKETLDK